MLMNRLSKLMVRASNVRCTMVNGSSIVTERIEIAEERGIRRGIREKGENRLSTDDLTIKANISIEQCSVYYGDWVKHLSREDINC